MQEELEGPGKQLLAEPVSAAITSNSASVGLEVPTKPVLDTTICS